ncbi:hypothetical protein GJU40_10090 [Bacillus lacus]|uniref:Uncharacterized protein n=1 Tax=Metabacillus lacus TaxID=1983721 RepID=A0A7X2IZH0_9BACI|nr:hypothetical protein [Metabacillus lacus]MRX72494.1 hypothetical protein [Metabacillus lacus]
MRGFLIDEKSIREISLLAQKELNEVEKLMSEKHRSPLILRALTERREVLSKIKQTFY